MPLLRRCNSTPDLLVCDDAHEVIAVDESDSDDTGGEEVGDGTTEDDDDDDDDDAELVDVGDVELGGSFEVLDDDEEDEDDDSTGDDDFTEVEGEGSTTRSIVDSSRSFFVGLKTKRSPRRVAAAVA